jgi:hypothetical protein
MSATLKLVQIQKAPPLHQSTVGMLACPRSYVAVMIDGLRPPPSVATDRGDDVHEVAAAYTTYCVAHQIPGDWEAFDRAAAMAGPEAARILEGVRENYVVDYEHVIGTEVEFFLDENFQPSTGNDSIAYSGTRDIDLLMDETHGETHDWKSNIMPYPQSEVPNIQSDMYALSRFQENQELEHLTFRFRFVRYGKCERVAEYTRKDIPRLMATMEAHRRRQLAIHANPEQAEAIPSKQCLYCPLLNTTCPIPKDLNPASQLTREQRLKLAVYLSYATQQNNQWLKEWHKATGEAMSYMDGKGDTYVYGTKSYESQVYPLLQTMQALLEYEAQEKENPSKKVKGAMVPDVEWIGNLLVSSTKFKSYLKAKSRAPFHQFVTETVAVPVTKTRTGLHRADDNPEHEEGEE